MKRSKCVEIKVYIVNLDMYNEGVLQGSWFTLPVDFDFVSEKIGLNDKYKKYLIKDFESPIDIPEYLPVVELNNMYNKLCEVEEHGIEECDMKEVISRMGGLDELYCKLDSIVNHGHISFDEYIYDFLEEQFDSSGIDMRLLSCIDYDMYVRYLRTEENFIEASNLYQLV